MGSSQSKITHIKYFDGSQYSGQINQIGQEHGRGKIQYANKNTLQGKFYQGDCVKAQIKYTNGNQYRGQLQRFLYHGHGILKTPQLTMEGLFREGKFVYGKVGHKDWNYQGSLVNMKKTGFATLHLINQRVIYEGYFKDDLFQGTGELESTDEWYEGQFQKGKYDGVGVLKGLKDGEPLFMYEGQFKKGKIQGQGKITYSNHDIYEGEFFQGLKNGKGVYKYSNGDIYRGKFAYDLKNDSNCEISFRDSTSNYKGGIKDGKYHGRGTLTNSENRTKFQGQFKQGFKNGKGNLTTPDYSYQGDFKDDLKQGFGKINFNSGEVFEGWFLNGMKNGKGKSVTNKQTIIANYEDDIKNGPYQIISTKEYEYYEKGSFLKGVRHGHIYIKKGSHQRSIVFDNGIQQDEDSEL